MIHGILGGDQEERRFQFVVPAINRHLTLGHGFEQADWVLGVGAVDFIGQDKLCEERAGRNQNRFVLGLKTESPG